MFDISGLRKVYPYYFTFTTFTKGRWVGEKILEVFGREFRAHPVEEYVSSLSENFKRDCMIIYDFFSIKSNFIDSTFFFSIQIGKVHYGWNLDCELRTG